MQILIVNVGQGDAFVLQTSTLSVLVDGGDGVSKEYDNLTKTLNACGLIDRKNCLKLDIIVATHLDNDHWGGIVRLMREYCFEGYIIGGNWDQMKPEDQELFTAPFIFSNSILHHKFQLVGENLSMLCQWHPQSRYERLSDWNLIKNRMKPKTINRNSIATVIRDGPFGFGLLTADLDLKSVQKIFYDHKLIRNGMIKMFQVPHHGAVGARTEEAAFHFYQSFCAKVYIISANGAFDFGNSTRGGHPSIVTLSAILYQILKSAPRFRSKIVVTHENAVNAQKWANVIEKLKDWLRRTGDSYDDQFLEELQRAERYPPVYYLSRVYAALDLARDEEGVHECFLSQYVFRGPF